MEVPAIEIRRPFRETPAERLSRLSMEFLWSLWRMALLTVLLAPLILASLLTADIPVLSFDHLVGNAQLKPSRWLTVGVLLMSLVAPAAILIARRFGGEEAGRAIMAAWGVAAVAVFAELTLLAPVLETGDMPPVQFVVGYVGAAMVGQFVAVAFYDIVRGGGQWWRAPLYALIAGYAVHCVIYFPVVYWSQSAPWPNLMVTDFASKSFIASVFLGVYGLLRRRIRPRGGYGG